MNVILKNIIQMTNLNYSLLSLFSTKTKGLPKKLPIAGVNNVILVSSAKGGVGKSLISVNLAYAMKNFDPSKNIGILDADVYGPSLPTMIGCANERPRTNKQNLILPIVNYGIQCMSMGFLIDEDKPIVWRGLMVMSAIEKLLRTIYWGQLDALIIDMPPGTGDVQLSIIQNIPINGVIIVSTPQKVCIADVKRGAKMFNDLNVPIYGIVKNMSHFVCEKCSNHQQIYNTNELEILAKEFNAKILVDIPWNSELSKSADDGCPLIVKDSNHNCSKIFVELAQKVLQKL